MVTNKEFWKSIKPSLTNKGCLENSDIILINDDEMVTDDTVWWFKTRKIWNLKIHLIPAEIFYIVL